jgi:hypothetical protein
MYKASDMDVLNRQFSVNVKEAPLERRFKVCQIAAIFIVSVMALAGSASQAGVVTDHSTRECDAPALSKTEFEGQLLAAHNSERSRFGSPLLVWDRKLTNDAEKWAQHLAQSDSFEHASGHDQGENLWMGDSGAYQPAEMVGLWASEKALFRPGIFPAVSRSTDWTDVGHYTQLIWPSTTKVGCALARGNGNDYLVCRYNPAGNVVGTKLSQTR